MSDTLVLISYMVERSVAEELEYLAGSHDEEDRNGVARQYMLQALETAEPPVTCLDLACLREGIDTLRQDVAMIKSVIAVSTAAMLLQSGLKTRDEADHIIRTVLQITNAQSSF